MVYASDMQSVMYLNTTEAVGSWKVAYDEKGAPFWCNNVTQETTYYLNSGRGGAESHPSTVNHSSLTALGCSSSSSGNGSSTSGCCCGSCGYMPSTGVTPAVAAAAAGHSNGYMSSPTDHMLPTTRMSPTAPLMPFHSSGGGCRGVFGGGGISRTASGVRAPLSRFTHSGYRWEQCYRQDGTKFWRNRETGVLTERDPYY